ncbi:MAG: bifunctional homocysteine S-methyltransferase/methylenetetrahydrofolate reductase [Planctomycetia bacterium]|nr:bifunctional homocysteine S-methyltransferase/methylenetetrahydrofolate reductase [Planctomycetia bacterium]
MFTQTYHPEIVESLLALFQKEVLVFDGAMGTEIYNNHIFTNRCYDELNLVQGDLIRGIHLSYLKAGADVLTTNTIGANPRLLKKYGLTDKTEAINRAGVELARSAIEEYRSLSPKNVDRTIYVAGSVGRVAAEDGSVLESSLAVDAMAVQIQCLLDAGVDFIFFETLQDGADLENAVLAVREVQKRREENIPFMLSLRPVNDGRGVKKSPTLKTLSKFTVKMKKENYPRPFAWGLNCGLGPEEILPLVEEVVAKYNVPWIIQPNAGSPKSVEGRSLYMTSPEYFTTFVQRYINLGVKGVGGCCGITPGHLHEMAKSVKPLAKARLSEVTLKAQPKEVPLCDEMPLGERSGLGKRLAKRQWVTSVELVPPQGYDLTQTIARCVRLRELGVNCVNIPDGPRASCRISAMVTADRIQQEAEIETILHFCCRDRNLIGMQSDLLGCAACGIHNILFITGDPPKLGDYPDASGVFDTDSVGMARIQRRMNRGVDVSGKKISKPTEAVVGVGLDPTALDRNREVDRFFRKVEAGAEFAITQPVFDPETLLEILERVKPAGVPIFAGIFPLANLANAKYMQTLPGVNIPDAIMARMERAESREQQQAVGIAVAREAIEKIRTSVSGIQVSAPFGNIDIVSRVLEGYTFQ